MAPHAGQHGGRAASTSMQNSSGEGTSRGQAEVKWPPCMYCSTNHALRHCSHPAWTSQNSSDVHGHRPCGSRGRAGPVDSRCSSRADAAKRPPSGLSRGRVWGPVPRPQCVAARAKHGRTI
eukprot:362671-Chlamydomonas_euryale.AAC.5